MDLATLIGLVGAFAFIIMSMLLGGSLDMYVDTPSLMIVFGGSLFVVLIKHNLGQFLGAGKVAAKAFIFKPEPTNDLIGQLVELSDIARKGGFLALEEVEIDNPFMKKGIDLLVDGYESKTIKQILHKDIGLTNERHNQGINIFSSLGDVSPAMGMIGTLVGLVAMLSNMDDPKSIGPAMAVALLTTLYGSMLSNMVALPIADKLTLRKEQETLNRRLILDGLLAIQEGQNPRLIEGLLNNYVHENKRTFEMAK